MGLLRCAVCREKFSWDLSTKWPRHCPLCGEDINNDRPDDDVVMPFIRSSQKRDTSDAVYRAIEAGSEIRAQVAAEMLGESPHETGLKITNMSDRRDSEIAHIELPNNPVGQMMAQNKNLGFGQGGLGYSGPVSQGSFPNSGLQMQGVVKSEHASNVAKHAVGIDAYTARPARPSTDVVFDNPSREVMQPGYRRRR